MLSPNSCRCDVPPGLHHYALQVQAGQEELKVGMSSNLKPINANKLRK